MNNETHRAQDADGQPLRVGDTVKTTESSHTAAISRVFDDGSVFVTWDASGRETSYPRTLLRRTEKAASKG